MHSDTNNIIVMAHGKSFMKSRNMPLSVIRNGKNVIDMAHVAENIALRNSTAER